MDDELRKILTDEGFEEERDGLWTKFNGNKEYYVKPLDQGYEQAFAYNPLDDNGDTIKEDSFYKEKNFEKVNLSWFSDIELDHSI